MPRSLSHQPYQTSSAHPKRAALFIRMNDLVVGDPGVIPDVYRPRVDAIAKNLRVPLSGWDNDFWNLRDWYRET